MKLISTATVSEKLNLSRKSVLEKARRESWKYVKRGNKFFWLVSSLSASDQAAITGKVSLAAPTPPATQAHTTSRFSRVSEKQRDVAKVRILILNDFATSGLTLERFCADFNSSDRYATLRQLYGKVLSLGTLQRWKSNYAKKGTDGITPNYIRTRSPGSSLTEEEKNILKHFYLTFNQRSIRHCYLSMRANLPESTATENTCRRYLNSLPRDMVTLYRQGTDRFNDLYLPYIEGNKELYRSLDKVQGDHHKIDVLVTFGEKRIRPWLTSFIDYASGLITGYSVSVTPSSRSILVAYYQTVTQYGVPHMVHVDNGKDYRGKAIKGSTTTIETIAADGKQTTAEIEILGGISMCGSKLHYARPYSGRSKGVVERFHRTFAEYFSKNTISYLGSDTTARVDEQRLLYKNIKGFKQRNDILSFDDCVHMVDAFIAMYNTTTICSDRQGKSPAEVFRANAPETFDQVEPETLELALTRGEVKRVKRNGVTVGGKTYWCESLMRLVGQQVIVRVSLTNEYEVLICDSDGRLIARAQVSSFYETGSIDADNERITRVQNTLRTSINQDASIALKFKPKTLVEIAAEKLASQHKPVPVEQVQKLNQDLKRVEQTSTSNKYKSYFDISDDDFLSDDQALSQGEEELSMMNG